ncbi:flagellar motor protein MotB [Pelagibaculum spongiae]|uniref:Flagellar motor protein MotD n=1 Tax=Pelagibaculum spongiae TaxID=2080658 RepID=A0A2V1GUW2_9GAMM|nr:flagellar motor protein MotB [Pelagibaculum spongiae]PVZ66688.1 flagellar motor protein MotD [Pelagibaculum spongiae]
MIRWRETEVEAKTDRWLISYADFITLLFAFFVVMYAISTVEQEKYRSVSESLGQIFETVQLSIDPIQIGIPVPVKEIRKPEPERHLEAGDGKRPVGLQQINEELKLALADQLSSKKIRVTLEEDRLEIELKNQLLFQPASARIQNSVKPLLRSLGMALSPYMHPVHVEGFTDDRPVDNFIYPSNWELSAARAAAVVRSLANYGVLPQRLSATGYGEYFPINDNADPLERADNRRVLLIITQGQQYDRGWRKNAVLNNSVSGGSR